MAESWDPRAGASPPPPGSMHMKASQLKTVTVPGVGGSSRRPPSAIAVAMDDRPMRVMLDNVGAVPVRLSFAQSALGSTTAEGTDHYVLTTSAQGRVFILAPKQSLYAAAIGADGRVSVHTSDALPYDATTVPA